jgi:hypothetical protein
MSQNLVKLGHKYKQSFAKKNFLLIKDLHNCRILQNLQIKAGLKVAYHALRRCEQSKAMTQRAPLR